MDFSAAEIRLIVEGLLFLVVSICVHEFGHAIVADLLGDPLPRSQGRTTLNPLAHADPIGTVAFPLVALVLSHGHSLGFGWGKPVMVNPTAFTRKMKMRTAHMLVAAAGPAMNIVLGVIVTVTHLLLLKFEVIKSVEVNSALLYAGMLNFGLAVFNCIPAPPLDGGTIVEGLLPNKYVSKYQEISVYGPFLLMAIIMIEPLRDILVFITRFIHYQWCNLIGLAELLHLGAP